MTLKYKKQRIQASYWGHRSRKELRKKGPPNFLQELRDVLLVEGSAAKLECRVGAFPDPFIVWLKDRKELKYGPKYRYVFEDPDVVALVVCDGERADLSRFTVTIKNPFGQTSGSACIMVEECFFDVGDTNTILTIKNAQPADAGKYKVFVENNLGTDQSFARVDIL